MGEDAVGPTGPVWGGPPGATSDAGPTAGLDAAGETTAGELKNELARVRRELARLAEKLEAQPSDAWSLWRLQLGELEKRVSFGLATFLNERDSAVKILARLRDKFTPGEVAVPQGDPSRMWELAGLFYLYNRRYHEALWLFSALYDRMLEAQNSTGYRCHKGMPLCWISDCYWLMGFPVLAKRYLMLTLCEDALSNQGALRIKDSGVYHRMVWRHGMSDERLRDYFELCCQRYLETEARSLFPEEIIQGLDHDWMIELPAQAESGIYSANVRYIRHLTDRLGDGTGKALELLAEYLMSCMPGCRTARHVFTHSTDLDVVCSVDGLEADFRSELGRYFVCECKDWSKAADTTAFAKFCRILDSVKARFGILFSKEGLSGEGTTENAAREQLKVFQDRGMVIVVIDKADLEELAEGANFANMLRQKYEMVRLDLAP